MKLTSKAALAFLLAGGTLAAMPAAAQQPAPAQPAAWAPKFSKAEVKVLQPVEAALKAQNWAGVPATVAAAQPQIASADGKYYLGRALFQAGTSTQNAQLQAQGLDAMIASGGGDQSQLALLHKSRGALALQAKDWATAEASFTRFAQLSPNDPDAQLAVAQIKLQQKKPQEALALSEKAIATRQAAGQAIPENWYLLAIQSALDAKQTPKTVALSRSVIGAYPTARNWRNGMLIYRQSANQDPGTRLDTLRLMRAAKALESDAEYLSLADQLARGSYYAEAQAVLAEGRSAGKIQAGNANAAAISQAVSGKIAGDKAALPGLEARARGGANGSLAQRLADGYYGHGDYAKAAEFYRVALQKGGVDSPTVNTRLGIALAQAGQKAEAEAAFKAVTGPRSTLASYWLIWLNQRA